MFVLDSLAKIMLLGLFKWGYQMEIYLKGKELWSHVVDGEKGALNSESSATTKAAWETKDAQIMSRILGSVESIYSVFKTPQIS